MERIVVVGGGQAGASLVAKLRDAGFAGPLTLVCEEGVPPYQRPPLSKKYLLGEMEAERLFLRPEAYYAEQNIDLRLNTTANAIDRRDKVLIAGGEAIPYGQLALATGSVPRRLPGCTAGAISSMSFSVRTTCTPANSPPIAPGRRLGTDPVERAS